MVAKLAQLGIVSGKDYDLMLNPAVAPVLSDVPKMAQAQITGHFSTSGIDENGWVFAKPTGLYGADYLQRAFITDYGLGANRTQDAIYPQTGVDSDGKSLNGANNYVIHFAKGQTPPVNGFWSLTMYDAEHFVVANSLNR